MPILKKTDIIEKGPYLKQLNEELVVAEKNTKELTNEVKGLTKAYKALQKTNDGAEAKKLNDATVKLTTTTKKLTEAKTVEQRAAEKLVKTNKKLSELYTPQAKAIEILNQKSIQRKKVLREEAKATLGVQKANNGLINAFKSMGRSLLSALGPIAVIALLVDQFRKAAQRSGELIKSTNKLKNTFDLTTKQAQKLAIKINAIANNFEGVDTQNLEVSLAAILGTFKNLSESEALDLIQEGFQKGSNNSGEFLDILKEYPVQFKAAGIDAKTMFAIINQQVKQGIYSDKGVDTIKEGGLRLRENTKAVQEALKPLDDSIKLQIEQEIAAGNSFKAIQLVSEALKDTSLTAEETQTIIADVFGGAGEDAGIEYIKTLADIETNLDNVAKQTTINQDANFRLTEGYNAFVLSVNDGDGVLSSAFANVKDGLSSMLEGMQKINSEGFGTKMKVMANGVLNVVNAISFGGLDKALKNVTQSEEAWRFDTDKQTEALKDETTEIKENTEEIKKNETEIKKVTKAVKEFREETEKGRGSETGGRTSIDSTPGGAFPTPDTGGIDPVKFNDDQNDKKLASDKKYLDDTQKLEDDAAATEKQRAIQNTKDIEQAKKDIVNAAFDAAQQIASDIFAAGQEAKLAQLEESNEQEKTENEAQAEADKEILRQKLEDGLITETEFKEKSAEIDEELRKKNAKLDLKFRQEQAKAEKKAALFAIAINAAVAVARQLALSALPLSIPFLATMASIVALQAAVVLAKPLPKFGKGEVDIQGLSHNEGGINANIEGHESVINTLGTSNAPKALQAINDGLLKDSDIGMMKNSNNYSSTMLQLNGLSSKFDENIRNTHQTNEYLKHMYSSHENSGMIHFKNAHGKSYSINKINE